MFFAPNRLVAKEKNPLDIFDSDEKTYKTAIEAQEKSDIAKSIVLFDHIIRTFPQSKYLEDAKQQKENLIRMMQNQYSQDAIYRKITSLIQSNQTYPAYELAENIIVSYPVDKVYNETRAQIKETLADEMFRFKIYSISLREDKLVFSGTKEINNTKYLVFNFQNKIFYKQIGDNILYYKITSYDDITRSIELIPLTDLPYNLLQNNTKETYRHFSARISNIQQNLTYRAYIFLDYVETKMGNKIQGFCLNEDEGKIYVDYPVGKTTMRLSIGKNKMDNILSFSTADTQSILEKKIQIEKNNNSIPQIKYYIASKQYTEALLKYFSIENTESADTEQLNKLYMEIVAELVNKSLAERLLDRGEYLFKNGYFYTGFTELDSLISSNPSGEQAIKAQNMLIDSVDKPEHNLYITSIDSVPFPFTFMGYTKMSESEEIYQINYKNNSYFFEKNQTQSGFKFIKTEEKTVEIYNPDLNTSNNHNIRWVIVEPEKTRVFRLKENEGHCDTNKLYIEIQDRWTGKIYPGYILLDSLKTAKNENFYGFIKEDKLNKEFILYENILSEDSKTFKQNEITQINRNSFFDSKAFSDIEKFLGFNIFSGIKKFFGLEKVDESAVKNFDNEGKPVETKKKPVQKNTDESKKKPQTKTATKKLTPTNKNESKLKVQPEKITQKNELKIREEKLKLKKKIIKLLGLFIVLWLIYIAYKLFRAIKY